MALNLPAAIKVTAEVQGSQSLNALARQLQQLSASSQLSGRSLDRLYTETRKLGGAAGNTISSLRSQATALKALRDEAEFGSRKFRLLTRDIEAVEARLKKYQQTASQTGGLSKGNALLAGFAGGVAGYASGMIAGKATEAVQGIAQAGLNAESAQVRLKALTTQFGEYNQAQVSTERIARTLRISQTEASDGFAQLYAALRPTGVTLKETEDAFVGFTAAARVSGATSTEASAALLQLKQALGSGVLQGDELRSIREQAPLVGQAIAKEMGVTVGELKKLGSEGKITTDIVLRALATLKDENLDKLNQQFDTGAQAIKDFQVAAENLGKALSRIFGPTVVALIRDVTRGLQDMTDVLGSLSGDKDSEERLKNKIRARDMAADETGKRFGISGLWRQGEKESFFQQRQQQILDRLEEERLVKKEQAAAKEAASRDAQRNKDQAAGERQAARERAAATAREDEVKIRQQAEEKLKDAVQRRDQELADFRQQTVKRAADLERQLGDERLKVEREIEASRRATARAQEDIALERQLQQRRAAGLSVNGLEEARATRELFRQFEDQVTQQRQSVFDRQQALARQLEEFKVSIAEGIGKIQEAYARSVSSILQDAGDKLAQKMEKGAQNAAAALGGANPGGDINVPGTVGKGAVPIAKTLISALGITPAQAAGIVGNLQRESGLNPRVNEGGFVGLPMGTGGYGLAQWTGDRQQALRRFANYDDKAAGDLTTQIRFLIAELRGPESKALAMLRTAKSPEQAAVLFDKYYERSGIKALGERTANARAIYTSLENPGSARRLIGGGAGEADVSAGRQGVEAAGEKLRQANSAAQQAARESAFGSLMSGLQGRLSAATTELDAQARSAREKLEDERMYALLLSQGVTPELAQQRVELERIATTEREKLQGQLQEIDQKIQSGQLNEVEIEHLKAQRDLIEARIASQGASIAYTEEEIRKAKELRKAREESEGKDVGKGLKDGVKSYLESVGTLADGIKDATSNALKGLEDQLVNFVTTGKANFKELARSILADMARIAIQQFVLKPILGALFPSANGNVFGPGGVVPYAMGGVVTRPTIFPFADGGSFRAGIMGEAGPEAILPLQRGPDGRLGVINNARGGGGGSTVVNVSVDASGSSVQGDAGQGQQLGRVIAVAVQNELIKQKRPGGLLAA